MIIHGRYLTSHRHAAPDRTLDGSLYYAQLEQIAYAGAINRFGGFITDGCATAIGLLFVGFYADTDDYTRYLVEWRPVHITLPFSDTLDESLVEIDSYWRFPDTMAEVLGQWVHTHPETDLTGLELTTQTTIR